MRRPINPIVFSLSCLLAAAPALAQASKQQIPQELLDLDHQRIMKDCVPGFGEETCTVLANCTVAEFKKRLDFNQYLDMSVQLSRNEIGDETRKLLDSIATHCTAEMEKSGVPVGDGKEGGSR